MVNYLDASLDSTFAALSDATRRGILARLARGDSSVSELAAPYNMSLPGVSKHLRVLEGAGLLARHKEGRVHRCRLIADPMKDASDWIERYRQFWEQQFDALALYLAVNQHKEKTRWRAQPRDPKQSSKSGERSQPGVKQSSQRGRSAST